MYEVCPKSNETGVIKTVLKNIEIYQSQISFHFETLVLLPFPGFNTPLEGIFWDLFELHRRGNFDVIDVRKMSSLQNRLDLGKKEKVTAGQIRRIWGVFQSCNVPFCKKLTNT